MITQADISSIPDFTVEESLPRVSRWTTVCGLLLVGTFSTVLTLTAVIKYPVKVTATSAVVRPVGDIRFAQAPTEGRVKAIYVTENQLVRQGDAIAALDDAPLQIKKSQLLETIRNSQLQLTQVDNQLSTLITQRLAEAQLSERTIVAAQADLVRNQREYQDQNLAAQTAAQEAESEFVLAQKTLDRYQQLADAGAIAAQQLDEKQQGFDGAFARLNRAKAGLNPSTAAVTIAREQIAQTQARGESTLATLDKERETLNQRRTEVQSQLERDRKESEQLTIEIASCIIRASQTGTLLKLQLRNVGQVVRAAEPIAQIVPNHVPLVVKALVDNQDISKVALNQTAYLRINAYPYPDYGILEGKVTSVSPDTAQMPLDSAADQSQRAIATTYEVTIQPETLHLGNNPKNAIRSGMEVTAEIIARDETVLTFLLRKARLLSDL